MRNTAVSAVVGPNERRPTRELPIAKRIRDVRRRAATPDNHLSCASRGA
jgi:hypothetical protein